jgi:hypothetical protein
MGWNLIDAFASLEEREEAARPGAETNESKPLSPPSSMPREPVDLSTRRNSGKDGT